MDAYIANSKNISSIYHSKVCIYLAQRYIYIYRQVHIELGIDAVVKLHPGCVQGK